MTSRAEQQKLFEDPEIVFMATLWHQMKQLNHSARESCLRYLTDRAQREPFIDRDGREVAPPVPMMPSREDRALPNRDEAGRFAGGAHALTDPDRDHTRGLRETLAGADEVMP